MRKRALFHKVRAMGLGAIFICALFISTLTISNRPANAVCYACPIPDCLAAELIIRAHHELGETLIMEWISLEFTLHREWLTNTFFLENVLPALMLFTEQMSAVAMQQVQIIGSFLDAKHQLETQRLFQELQAQAHKDYHPSEDFCWFGTNVRSLAASEARGQYNAVALSQRALTRHLGNVNANSARNRDQDKKGRWNQFTTTYCDPKDNNWQIDGTGLDLACQAGGIAARKNKDIDYTRLIDEPRTLNVDFVDDTLVNDAQDPPPVGDNSDEQDILAMANNLYGHDVLTRKATNTNLRNVEAQKLYLGLRSVAAKRSVAENSFNAIVGLKSAGTSDTEIFGADPPPQTREFLASILLELGMPEEEIFLMLGERPSYYAQLEILSKKIYQNPDFYANLYDKPVNVERKKVALQAIELMLDRAIYESQIRQEMVMSVLLSSRLRKDFRDVNKDISGMSDR